MSTVFAIAAAGTGAAAGVSGWYIAVAVALLAVSEWLKSANFQSEQRDAVDAGSKAKSELLKLENDARSELEELAAQHAMFADLLSELSRAGAGMADKGKTERYADFRTLVKQALDGICFMLHGDIDGVRAVVYQVAPDEESMQVVDFSSKGHRMDPQPFVRGNERGDKAFATLVRGEAIFVDSIALAPDEWAGSGTGYNTFITTPIRSRTEGFGLLTVDAPETDSLTEDDENDLRLIAGILAMIFAEELR